MTPATKMMKNTARVKMQSAKHRAYRARTKARAITLKGGRCEVCGFADERALRLHHIKPVRRGRNGLSKKARSSTESHLAVIHGDKGMKLLCANCSCIASARDWTANANITRSHDMTR